MANNPLAFRRQCNTTFPEMQSALPRKRCYSKRSKIFKIVLLIIFKILTFTVAKYMLFDSILKTTPSVFRFFAVFFFFFLFRIARAHARCARQELELRPDPGSKTAVRPQTRMRFGLPDKIVQRVCFEFFGGRLLPGDIQRFSDKQ